ncbi:cell cycle checkpoint control protein Rad9 [Oratosquilla oratoria]|uniref:cell cycle checkpoint control protein Rad9 n=1 Tax=Oratosquilla oratoria TaxID=337810 RepID=UPI003F764161
MKCVIPGINLKVFGRAVHSLARIGDELYVEPSSAGVSFRTVNSSRSAFSSFVFAPGFFSYYDSGGQPKTTADTDEDCVRCKVAMKGCVNVFKNIASLEKSVDKCKLCLDDDEAKFIIQLSCKHGIIKTYNLCFIECETLQAVYDKSTCPHHFTSQSRLLSEVVVNFQLNQEEVTFHTAPDKITVRNYVEDEPDPAKAIHTELTLQADEFDEYLISEEVEITFCLKELRAVLGFTEPVNLPISAFFSEPGSPIIIIVENSPLFEANFVFATLSQGNNNNDRSTAANASMNKAAAKPSQKTATPSIETTRRISSFHSNILATTSSALQNGSSSARSNSPSTSKPLEKPLPTPGPSMPVRQKEVTPGPSLSQSRCDSFRQDSSSDNAISPRTGSPVPKKAKFIFQRCFNATFNPESIPGYGVVLASDSDEED